MYERSTVREPVTLSSFCTIPAPGRNTGSLLFSCLEDLIPIWLVEICSSLLAKTS